MVAATLRHRLGRYRTVALIALWCVLVLGALVALALTSQNSARFQRVQPWILLASALGIVAFGIMLARKIAQLIAAYRAGVPGSRLTSRTVFTFGALVVGPLLVVYVFSLEFLDRSVDSWFRVEVKQGLNDALVLSRAALDLRLREHAERTQRFADEISIMADDEAVSLIDEERRDAGAEELVLFGEHERVIAASTAGAPDRLLSRPPPDLIRQVNDGRTYLSLEPIAEGEYVIRTAVPVVSFARSASPRYLVAVYRVPQQLAALADAVQRSYSQYGDLAALREPLKYSFRLTLTMVLLVTMLASIYGAIFSAERLFRPVQDLMAGTRAVAKGDLGTRLPLTTHDEMGFLVQSFNDMTKRLRRARQETEQSRQAAERERERLAIILARLSTGVIVVDRQLRLRSANEAARGILGPALAAPDAPSAEPGPALDRLAEDNPRLRQFVAEVSRRFAAERFEWRDQIELIGESGARVLVCACVPLPGEAESEPGYVIVFDEVTQLINAQREAAWGEVARRLAHEIKNPLTPIQLAAERMRRRFLANMAQDDAQVLERATHTIVQQVEAMKQMVNAFSEYARAPNMHVAPFGLNALVGEVTELYRAQDPRVAIVDVLDESLGAIEADRGRVRQILNNLLTNALEALEGRSEGRIEVRTRAVRGEDGDWAELAVDDNGPGFQREMMARLFDPYVTSKPRGTGLGLAIVRKIVEEHGGRIEAENRPEGGARVRVMLPMKDRSRATAVRERKLELRRERA